MKNKNRLCTIPISRWCFLIGNDSIRCPIHLVERLRDLCGLIVWYCWSKVLFFLVFALFFRLRRVFDQLDVSIYALSSLWLHQFGDHVYYRTCGTSNKVFRRPNRIVNQFICVIRPCFKIGFIRWLQTEKQKQHLLPIFRQICDVTLEK